MLPGLFQIFTHLHHKFLTHPEMSSFRGDEDPIWLVVDSGTWFPLPLCLQRSQGPAVLAPVPLQNSHHATLGAISRSAGRSGILLDGILGKSAGAVSTNWTEIIKFQDLTHLNVFDCEWYRHLLHIYMIIYHVHLQHMWSYVYMFNLIIYNQTSFYILPASPKISFQPPIFFPASVVEGCSSVFPKSGSATSRRRRLSARSRASASSNFSTTTMSPSMALIQTLSHFRR